MDPELKAFLDKYTTAHPDASDDELRNAGHFFLSQRGGSAPPVPVAAPAQAAVQPAPKPNLAQRAIGALQSLTPFPTASDIKAFTPSNLATEAQNLGQMIPGGKALQAVSLMLPKPLGEGLGYSDAYNRVGQMVSGLPTSHKVVAGLAGAAATGGLGSLVGATPAVAGAVSGGLNAALNPNYSPWRRAIQAPLESAVGAAIPAVTKMIAARIQSGAAPSADVVASGAKADRIANEQLAFSKVADEAEAAGGSSPAIRAELARPDIAPMVEKIRGMRGMEEASDADVLQTARALMSQRQGTIIGPPDAADLTIGSSLEKRALGLKKAGLMGAATAEPNPAMPSYSEAIDTRAQAMQARDAGELAAKFARRQFGGAQDPIDTDKLEKLGQAGFNQTASTFSPLEQQMAQARVLAELKNYPVFGRLAKAGWASHIPTAAPSIATRQAPDVLSAVGASVVPDWLARMLAASATAPFGR